MTMVAMAVSYVGRVFGSYSAGATDGVRLIEWQELHRLPPFNRVRKSTTAAVSDESSARTAYPAMSAAAVA